WPVPRAGHLSEERRLGPALVVARFLEAGEPEGDVADGGLAPLDVDLPPAVGGSDEVAEVAARLGLLDHQGREVGEVVLEAEGLQRLEQLGRDGPGRFLDPYVLAADTEVVV